METNACIHIILPSHVWRVCVCVMRAARTEMYEQKAKDFVYGQ